MFLTLSSTFTTISLLNKIGQIEHTAPEGARVLE
jgi:hypothetical protein